jgi:protein-S-isoprenylcysteine O-methyltransferase Ste14
MAGRSPNPRLLLLMTASGIVFLSLAALGWGGWGPLLADPARLAGCAVMMIISLAAGFSTVNLNSFRQPGMELRWLLIPIVIVTVVMAWLPAETDRRDVWTLDGTTVRVLGVALLAVGGTLRVAPMFVLGERFGWPLAPQETHRLVTTGLYRVIRHPSYLGALLGGIGWTLLFRSGPGLLLLLALVPLMAPILHREEALLLSEFGEEYEAYRRRTWRLIPWVY